MIDDPLRPVLAIYALAALVSCGSTCRSEAQRPVPPEVIHARACVGELGWSAPDEACVAIVEVHRRRAALSGLSPETVARRYSAALRRPPSHRSWVRELADRRESPRSWPRAASWTVARARFAALVNVAREALGSDAEVCPGALHYGSAELDPVPSGFVERCRFRAGRRHQAFYGPRHDRGGVWIRGEQHSRAKLTETQVREIRARHANGESRKALAAAFGMSRNAMRSLLLGKTWSHVNEANPS